MRILHFSDIHLDFQLRRVPLRDWFGKRLMGGGNYLLRRREAFRQGKRKLDALAALIHEDDPDLIVFSGDFTTLGTELELLNAREAIEPILATSASFVCVPGNHDVYLGDVVRQGRFVRNLGDLLVTDMPDLLVDDHWPIARLIEDSVAVVAVNSSRPNPRPWRSSGLIPHEQLVALSKMLADPRLADRFVFVVTHYPPCGPDGRPHAKLHGLDNATELMETIAPLGDRGALLCGHLHDAFHQRPVDGAPRVFCAGSATLEGREGFWQFDLDTAGRRVHTSRGRWAPEGWMLTEEDSWSYEAPAAARKNAARKNGVAKELESELESEQGSEEVSGQEETGEGTTVGARGTGATDPTP
ncbi:MAG TPA: metallophosphoesterase [Thermoanaerobaculia bacterium]|nr:metallophosphoesterase [Thermoanaerobaculia bacterium]